MTLDEILERANSCGGEYTDANCIGTALYLLGEVKEECSIEPEDAFNLFRKLQRIRKPRIGSLVVWYFGKPNNRLVDHAATIVSMQPYLVIHRPGWMRKLERDVPFEEVCNKYSGYKVAFFLPKNSTSKI